MCEVYNFGHCIGSQVDCCSGVTPGPTPPPAPPTPSPPTPAPTPKATTDVDVEFDITQLEQSDKFFVKLCYDDGTDCSDGIDCQGDFEEGHQIVTVDTKANYFLLHFGTDTRAWYVKDDTTHTWPATAKTCNSFGSCDGPAPAPTVAVE